MRIEHIAMNVGDPDALVQWYVQHLGMRVVRHVPVPNRVYFLADSAGQTVLEFYHNPAAAPLDVAQIGQLQLHYAFLTTDIEADVARLAAAGARLLAPIDTTPANDRLAFIRDPWDVVIQLVQRAEPLL